jgi:hypothetical protein
VLATLLLLLSRPTPGQFLWWHGLGQDQLPLRRDRPPEHKWKPYKHIFLLSPNVEAAIKGEYGILDDVVPLKEWPTIPYFDKFEGRKLLIADDNALAGLSTHGGVDSQRNRADRICGYVRTHKNL